MLDPLGLLKPLPFSLVFQHHPRGPADVSAKKNMFDTYTQTKKKRPIFMVLLFSVQLRCCNKNRIKMFIKRPTQKNGNYLIFSSDLEE